jgi:hypothetical protein
MSHHDRNLQLLALPRRQPNTAIEADAMPAQIALAGAAHRARWASRRGNVAFDRKQPW